jgi:hypothetical protein
LKNLILEAQRGYGKCSGYGERMQCLFLGSDAIVQEFDVLASFSQKIIQHGMFEERRLAHTWRSHAYHDVHNDGEVLEFWRHVGSTWKQNTNQSLQAQK